MLNEEYSFKKEDIYEAIKSLNVTEDIEASLPNGKYINSIDILNYIYEKLNNDYEIIKNEIEGIKDTEERLLFLEEKELIETKLRIVIERINEIRNEIITQTTITDNNQIIFARTEAGNLYIEKDFDDKWEESMLKEFSDCLESITSGQKVGDIRIEPFNNGNQILAGLMKAAGYQARIYYKKLAPNVYYVFYLQQKKKDNARDDIEKRWKSCKAEFETLKKQMKDESLKQQLIERDKPILEELREKLGSKRMGM